MRKKKKKYIVPFLPLLIFESYPTRTSSNTIMRLISYASYDITSQSRLSLQMMKPLEIVFCFHTP